MILFSAINLWCTKNLVDTQYLLGKILSNDTKKQELVYCPDPYASDVEIVFLNTCGFIKSGRDEMFEVAEKLLDAKKRVCIVGCGLQYFEKLVEDVVEDNENDKNDKNDENMHRKMLLKNSNIQVLSRNDFDRVSVEELITWYNSKQFDNFSFPKVPRVYTNIAQWFEYVKIAEWCMNTCSFCVIPQIRWTQKSQSIEAILLEVKDLVAQWVKEIILISQDTIRYGIDRYRQAKLLDLLRTIDQLEWDFVYRLLYLYPDIMTIWRFDELKKLEKFVPYFDLPLQHINSDLLKKMWRFSDVNKIKEFLKYIRESFDESYIRTNFIVWFPWETQEHISELEQFIKEWWFDNIALFEYHDEPLAASSKLSNKIEDSLISERFEKLKIVVDSVKNRNAIIAENNNYDNKNNAIIWYIMDFENSSIVVRPWLHAPEIDAYDIINLDQIKENISWGEELQLWDLIRYTL